MNWIKDKLKRFWKWIVGFFIGAAVAGTVANFTIPSTLIIPTANLDGQSITFSNTDDNTKENLIIRTDKASYNSPVVYFSIENTTATDQFLNVVFTLKDDKTQAIGVKEFISNADIPILSSSSQQIGTKTVTNWSDKPSGVSNVISLADSIKSDTKIAKKITIGNNPIGFPSLIPAGQTKFYKVNIIVPSVIPVIKSKLLSQIVNFIETQEFFIEAYGQGTYGHLDPTMTAVGDAQIDTAQFKLGSASGLIDAVGGVHANYVKTPDADAWTFNDADFSIDFFVRFNTFANNNYYVILGQKESATKLWWVNVNSQGATDQIQFGVYQTAYLTNIVADVSSNFSTNTWYHIAIVNHGTTRKIFKDGTAQTLSTDTYATGQNNLVGDLDVLGTAWADAGDNMDGWLDELRISKGTDLIGTADFTPTTTCYTYSASNVLLLHMEGADGSTTFTDDSTTNPGGCAAGGGGAVPVKQSEILFGE